MGAGELNWMNEHPEELEKYQGKWIGLTESGIVTADDDVIKVTEVLKNKFPKRIPCIFKVQKKDEQLIILWLN